MRCRLSLSRIGVFAMVVLLTGCDPFAEPASMMDEYVERVGRVLDVEAKTSDLPEVAQMPVRRERTRKLPELDIGILEFFSLYGCELQHIVGKKNSALGRVMQPVQRLRYELNFIRAAHECLPSVESDSLQESLADAAKIKRRALPLAIWNATWGAPEMDRFFTRSDGFLALDPAPADFAVLTSDLNRLNSWLEALPERPRPTMIEGLSDIHQRWQAFPVAGQLLQSARLLTARLGDVERLLEHRLGDRPLCFNQRPNAKADIMRNLFFNVYAKEVQPYMALVQKVRTQLIPLLKQMAARQAAAKPASIDPFFDSVLAEGGGSLWHRLDEAVHRHTKRWQALLDQCGMRPQA